MKAIITIDPTAKSVKFTQVNPRRSEFAKLCGSAPRVVARFPSGDSVLAARGHSSDPGFSLGGSAAIRSMALVVGRLDSAQEYMSPKSSLTLVEKLTRWVEPEACPDRDPTVPSVNVIVVDPESGTIDELTVSSTMTAIDVLIGEESAVLLRVNGEVVYGGSERASAWRWRKDGCVFQGRSVVAGSGRYGALANVITGVDNMKSGVEFCQPGSGSWVPYKERLLPD